MTSPLLLSPTRYLRSGYGLALPDGYTLSQLRTAIARAQEQVSRYCNVPKLPQAFDWRGGSMTDERQQWPIVNRLAPRPGDRRVYLNAGPIKAVTEFTLDLGQTYQVSVNPAQIYVNPMEQYVEVVAVSPTIIGVPPAGIPLGLYEPIARVSYTYGWSFPVSGDILEAESPKVFSAAYANWDETVDPVVFLDGVEQVSGYTVDFNDGTVSFTTAPSPGVMVTADYTYTAPSAVVDAIGYATTGALGSARMAARGMTGLQSLRVAEVALTAMQPGAWSQRNGVSIPVEAASLLDGFTFGSVF